MVARDRGAKLGWEKVYDEKVLTGVSDLDFSILIEALEDVVRWCGYKDSIKYFDALPRLREKIFPTE